MQIADICSFNSLFNICLELCVSHVCWLISIKMLCETKHVGLSCEGDSAVYKRTGQSFLSDYFWFPVAVVATLRLTILDTGTDRCTRQQRLSEPVCALKAKWRRFVGMLGIPYPHNAKKKKSVENWWLTMQIVMMIRGISCVCRADGAGGRETR